MQVELKVPVLPESVTEGTLGDWHKNVGDTVAADENIVDLETDKVVLEIVATSAGVIESIAFDSGDTVKSGEVLGVINTDVPAAKEASRPKSKKAEIVSSSKASSNKASPAVRKMINENDLAVDEIKPSGKKGAVLKKDVEQYIQSKSETPAQSTKSDAGTPSRPPSVEAPAAARNDRRVPMSRLRARIAERLKQAQNTAAMLTTFNEVNLKPMMDARASYRDDFEKMHGVKLGMMSYFTRATVEALKRFPVVNASIDGDDIVYHD